MLLTGYLSLSNFQGSWFALRFGAFQPTRCSLGVLVVFSLSRLALVYYTTKNPICQYLFEKKFLTPKKSIFPHNHAENSTSNYPFFTIFHLSLFIMHNRIIFYHPSACAHSTAKRGEYHHKPQT